MNKQVLIPNPTLSINNPDSFSKEDGDVVVQSIPNHPFIHPDFPIHPSRELFRSLKCAVQEWYCLALNQMRSSRNQIILFGMKK